MNNIKRIVVKVGTSSLTYSTGNINLRKLSELVEVLSDVYNSGVEIVLVSSGAIAVGVGKLGLDSRPSDIAKRQATAAVGQSELMAIYDRQFSQYSKTVAQMLLTEKDIKEEESRRHLIDTFEALLSYKSIPIVNENDSVSVEEIVNGDNDCLSAEVATLIKADALIIFTDIDGLYDKNPNEEDAKLIHVVEEINEDIEAMAGSSGTDRGTGGMITKIKAAKIATTEGIDTFILSSSTFKNLYDLLEGKKTGTLFKGKKQ
ncbi:MAG: glutamate 5-kinase [Erysipelotrichaceae bacterium]|nr:glutamate 5-kinase [Erysipelotrichaceae bacterium]